MSFQNTEYSKSKLLNYIQELAYAFEKSRVLFTACDFGVFNIIADGAVTSKFVAESAEIDPRGAERLLNALVSLGLLEKKGLEYKNTEMSSRFLVEGSKEYLGIMNHMADLWNSWSYLNDAIRSGKPMQNLSINQKNDEWVSAYVEASHWKALNEASEIVDKIDLNGVNKVLDLGAGTGQYAIEIIKKKPSIEAVVFDYPKVTVHTKRHVYASDMGDKITILSGDFLKDDFGNGYDLVLLSSIVNSLSIWDNVKLLQKVYDSMNIDGKVVINEVLLDDNRISPTYSALYSLNMLINTEMGDSYTETDIWIMLRESWFKDIYRRNTNFETSLIFATR